MRVQLVRVVEDRRLRRSRRSPVVVRRDRVQELRAHFRLQLASSILDQAKAEMDMAEQASLLRLCEPGPSGQLDRSADVMQERCSEKKVSAQPRMELRRLAAERRHPDRVLQQPTRITVVAVSTRGWQRTKRVAQPRIGEERAR